MPYIEKMDQKLWKRVVHEQLSTVREMKVNITFSPEQVTLATKFPNEQIIEQTLFSEGQGSRATPALFGSPKALDTRHKMCSACARHIS